MHQKVYKYIHSGPIAEGCLFIAYNLGLKEIAVSRSGENGRARDFGLIGLESLLVLGFGLVKICYIEFFQLSMRRRGGGLLFEKPLRVSIPRSLLPKLGEGELEVP